MTPDRDARFPVDNGGVFRVRLYALVAIAAVVIGATYEGIAGPINAALRGG